MDFNFEFVGGFLYKEVERKKFYHIDDFHKKYISLDFDKSTMSFQSEKNFEKNTSNIHFKEIHHVVVE
jgi:hypothetical protein